MKKKMLIIILVFIVLFLLLFGRGILMATPWNKQKAADIAKEYLIQNYQQEMQYVKTERPPINIYSQPYTVYFSPINDLSIVFEVSVSSMLLPT